MKINFGSVLLAASITVMGLSFTACSTTTPTAPTPVKQVEENKVPEKAPMSEEEKHLAYKSAMRNVGEQIQADPNYQKFGLSTDEDKSWFTDLTYKVWDRQISRGQFIAAGLEKYPGHSYEFELIADELLAQ
jgi:hypothetical protein